MSLRKFTWITAVLALAAVAAMTAGCGSNSSLGPSANATSRVRVFNALGCPAALTVDVLQASNSVSLNPAGSVAYGKLSSYVLSRSGNNINTNVYAGGTTLNPLAPQVTVNLDPHNSGSSDGTFTVVVSGVCGQFGNPAPQIKRFIDNPVTPAGGQALVRLVNLCPDAGPIAPYALIGSPLAAVLIPGFSANGVAYIDASGYVAITPIPGQPLNLQLRTGFPAGQTLPLPPNAGTVTIQAGSAYTLYVYGEVNPVSGGQALNLLAAQDAPITSPP